MELMDIKLQQAAEAATGFMPPAEGLALYEAAGRYAGRPDLARVDSLGALAGIVREDG